MKQRIGAIIVMGVLLGALWAAGPARAEISDEQKQQLTAVDESLKKAAQLLRAKKHKELLELLDNAQKTLEELKGAGVGDELAATEKKLQAAQRLLKKAGVNVPNAPAAPGTQPGGGAVSFTKGVAPILVGKCGNCHIRNMRGGFSMATYPELMKGSESGIVFNPGKAAGSVLIEKMASGEMPPNGNKVTPEELALISKWIDSGAKFDGDNETVPIASIVPQTDQPAMPALEVVKATGSESVQFVRDLAPVMVEQCMGCHGGMRPAGRLDLTTFPGVLRGGDTGQIISPGKPEESLIIQKLRATGEDRMPLRKPALEEEVIKKFETWIAEGAKLDWDDPTQPLELAVRIMVATKMTHEELSAARSDLADKNWRLGSPETSAERIEDDTFLLMGNLTPARMAEVAELAKAQQAKVAALLKAPADRPFLKGRMTIFAFNRRFDYSEFGTMVEKRELPADWNGHWRFNIVDAYGCLVAPKDDPRSSALLLAQEFAGAYVESHGKPPRWFSVGSAMVIAARAEPKDATVKQWEDAMKAAIGSGKTPEEFLTTGEVLSSDGAVMSYGLMKALMAKMPVYLSLLSDLEQGADFNQAFAKRYKGDPKTVAAAWARSAAYSKR